MEDDFPFIALLISNFGAYGQHAVSIYGGNVYESNSLHVLKKVQDTLDWAVGKDAETPELRCNGASGYFQLCPLWSKKDSKPILYKLANGQFGWDPTVRKKGAVCMQMVDGSKQWFDSVEAFNSEIVQGPKLFRKQNMKEKKQK